MSQRINISVSDDLYQKIQAFKDGLNISKLCQDALRQAVSIEEFRSQVGEDIERLAIAFKKEREKFESNLEGITKHGSFHDSPYHDFDDFGDFYFDGWVAGCIDVWERVCTKLSIHGFKKVKETPHGDE